MAPGLGGPPLPLYDDIGLEQWVFALSLNVEVRLEPRGREVKDPSRGGGLPTAELAAPIRAALDGTSQEVVLKAVNRRGKPLQVTVSVDPLSGSQPKPLGAVLLIEES